MTELRALAPHIALVCVGLIVILLDIAGRRNLRCALGAFTAAGALAVLALDWAGPTLVLWDGLARIDDFARAFDSVFLVALALVAIGGAGCERWTTNIGEFYGLLALATAGLMITASATSLLTLYVGVELSTICFMGLVGLARTECRSAEAALKLFVVGSIASAVMLYGCALLYGVARSSTYSALAGVFTPDSGGVPLVAWLGMGCVLAGLAFKIAAVPFHMWAPDVYQGAPTPVTAFLSTASKAGGMVALLRLLAMGLGDAGDRWLPALMLLSLASMIYGNLAALSQTNLKRLLAYSGIAQAGYLLVAVCGSWQAGNSMAASAVLMYAFLYAFTNIGGFMLADAMKRSTGSDNLTALRGLHRRSPMLALATLVVVFSLGGIPPLAGFVGKLYLFAAGWEGGQVALVVVGAVMSVVALYYYLRVALEAYIKEPDDATPVAAPAPLRVCLVVCVVMTLAIGVYPRPWIDLGVRASRSLAASALELPAPTARR